MEIEPNINIYGSKARTSALADFLELMAISRGRSLSQSDLDDLINDSSWGTILGETYTQPSTDYIEEPDARERAQKVFDLLEERSHLLGPSYPFQVNSTGLTFHENHIGEAYLVLLGISTFHAYKKSYKKSDGTDPKIAFEELTVIAMKNQGLLSEGTAFGTQKGNFGDLLKEKLGPPLGINPTPENGIVSKSAKDEGVDLVCVLGGKNDRRPGGRWFFIGQVTCAGSDALLNKLKEPSPTQWKDLLGIRVLPGAFLAIPYQIEKEHSLYLLGKHEHKIYDRLRLVPFLSKGIEGYQEFSQFLKTIQIVL